MNLYTFFRNSVNDLSKAGCDSPEFDVQQLFDFCLNINKTQLLLKANEKINDMNLDFFNECLEKRKNRVPLQYILGEWDFYKYKFKVGEGVLIPRPETEIIPDYIYNKFKTNPPKVVYDVCSGSGCLGLTIAKLFPLCKVYSIDISDDAIKYTTLNKEILQADNVTVLKADMLDETSPIGLPFADIIISNPPYIKTDELNDLQKEVQFEPALALDGGEDGLVFYRALKNNWFPFLNRDGLMILECGENQAKDILEIFLTSAKGARIIEDGQGIERIVVLKK
ncbi:MAG: peptide chain release factor N(5)-glutamine methyltransferase [Clostridia bacterium]|nr:peptide chain release factor N(5)-glutamine methyltransferase [Clostridia bacterium]MBR3809771.1 peptide chain release factor N(5)-glutamine methyltransferase [Clostridia bacterium]